MPTPFTHLETSQRLLDDLIVPQEIRSALAADLPAFLLGNIAADARTESGMKREDTHFYSYDKGIHEHPWRVMLQTHPSLQSTHSSAQRAFLAGYVAHLSIDEWWSLYMLGPHFALGEWGNRHTRFVMLHVLLIFMDERDLACLLPWQYETLIAAQPQNWTPFMSDQILSDWRDFIGKQILPDSSQTLQVLGSRINMTPADLRAILNSRDQMQADLWTNISPTLLADIEAGMYRHARDQLLIYWSESEASHNISE